MDEEKTSADIIDIILEKKEIQGKVPESEENPKSEQSLNILNAIKKQMDVIPEVKQDVKKSERPPEKKFGPKIPPVYKSPDTIFSDEEKKKIAKLLENKSEKVEIEASFGSFNQEKFYPGIKSLFHFNLLKWNLRNMKGGNSFFEKEYVDRVDIIHEEYVRRVESIDIGEIIYEKKIRIRKDTIDNKPWGIRISKSIETSVDEDQFNSKEWERIEKLTENPVESRKKFLKEIAVQRYRNRKSFTQTSKKGNFYGIKFDLTTVREIKIRENGKKETVDKYEIELERYLNSVSYGTFCNAIQWVMEKTQGVEEKDQLMDSKEKRIAVVLHNNMFWNFIKNKYKDPYRLYGGYRNKPVNIKLDDMLNPKFNPNVTIKMNGRRYSLLFSKNGTYIFNPPYDILKVGPKNDQLNGTLVDCEFLKIYDEKLRKYVISEIYGFDILFYKGKDVRSEDFRNRFNALERVKEEVKLYNIEYKTKTYFTEKDFYTRTRDAFSEIKNNKNFEKYDMVDGLIFQPSHWYKNKHTFKWKEIEDLTIDFRFIPMSEENISSNLEIGKEEVAKYLGKVFWLMVGNDYNFRGTKYNPYKGFVVLDSEKIENEDPSYKIIECSWNKNKREFEPYRIRDDRDKPNNFNTAVDVWNDIINPIPKETIKGYTLQLMRKYHNLEKINMLSKEFPKGSTILDIGSGRGGDLKKWDKIGINTVYAVEPNNVNLEEFKNRREKMDLGTNVYIVNTGAQDTEKISSLLEKNGDILDGIVSFFSLTFFTEKEDIYNGLLDTIDLLPEKGKFIGIVLDGEKVRELLEETRREEKIPEDETVEYDTKAYSIEQITEFDQKITGNGIEINIKDSTSMVKEQKEWLFYFEPFKNKLEEKGFKLVHDGFLDKGDYYDILPKSSKVFSSLNRKFVFQKVHKKYEEKFDLKVGETVALPKNRYGKDLYYSEVEKGSSNFVHAVLTAISKNYREIDREEKIKKVELVRQILARKMDLDVFKELHSGELSKRLQYPYLEEYSDEDAMEMAYLQFKLKIMDSKNWLGASSLLELMDMVFNVNIYILEYRMRKEEKVVPSSFFFKNCDKIYTNKKSIILFTKDNVNYYIVSMEKEDQVEFIFDSSLDFIQEIHKESCE